MTIMKTLASLFLLVALNALLIESNEQQQRSCLFIPCICGVYKGNDAVKILDLNCVGVEKFPSRDLSFDGTTISTFDFQASKVAQIPDDEFRNLTIEVLSVSGVGLKEISLNAFRSVKKIDLLQFGKNSLSYIHPSTFQPLFETSSVELYQNQLGEMSSLDLSELFKQLKNLVVLNLNNNSLNEVPDFRANEMIQELALAENKITDLISEELLPISIVELNLHSNQLTKIEDNTFSNLINLRYLNLDQNFIASISPNAFANLLNLKKLILQKNAFNHIPSPAFYHLKSIELLDFSSQMKSISSIGKYAFDTEKKIAFRKIDLSGNHIRTIDPKAFCVRDATVPYLNVSELNIASNSLESINACHMRQLLKGYHSEDNQHRPKVNFKLTKSYVVVPKLRCDCEVTKSTYLIHLEGVCQNEEKRLLPISTYQCSLMYSSHDPVKEIEATCSKSQYECPLFKNEDTSESKSSLEKITNEIEENSIQPEEMSDKAEDLLNTDNSEKSPENNLFQSSKEEDVNNNEIDNRIDIVSNDNSFNNIEEPTTTSKPSIISNSNNNNNNNKNLNDANVKHDSNKQNQVTRQPAAITGNSASATFFINYKFSLLLVCFVLVSRKSAAILSKIASLL